MLGTPYPGFRAVFGQHYEMVREVPATDSGRVIFLMRPREAAARSPSEQIGHEVTLRSGPGPEPPIPWSASRMSLTWAPGTATP